MTSYYNSPNTYVKSIVDVLKETHEIVCDVDRFWNANSSFSIIHIQWVEELFNWEKITEINLQDLKKQLLFWKNKNTKIVITRHNKLPHRKHVLDRELYDIAYENADAVVHLGTYSLESLKSNGINVSIPHVNYCDSVEKVSAETARQTINIPIEGNLFLSFGSIRDREEELQIIKGFKKIKTKNDYLLICNSLLFNKKPAFRNKPLSRLKYNFKKYIFKRHHIYFKRKRVLSNDLKFYLNAANIIISPRIDTLNSGVIYMGFSFSKVVIGPNIGNIGPVLRQLRNPVFEPNNIISIANSMRDAKKLIGSEIESRNYEYAKNDCSPVLVAKKHSELYKSLLNE